MYENIGSNLCKIIIHRKSIHVVSDIDTFDMFVIQHDHYLEVCMLTYNKL